MQRVTVTAKIDKNTSKTVLPRREYNVLLRWRNNSLVPRLVRAVRGTGEAWNPYWCQKTCVFLAPIRSQNGGDRLELVW